MRAIRQRRRKGDAYGEDAAPMKKAANISNAGAEVSASQLIDARIKDPDPDVVEEWKWRGVPVWSHGGILCTGETYKEVVKLTFAKGAALDDPSKLFNSSLEGSTRRAIDIRADDAID